MKRQTRHLGRQEAIRQVIDDEIERYRIWLTTGMEDGSITRPKWCINRRREVIRRLLRLGLSTTEIGGALNIDHTAVIYSRNITNSHLVPSAEGDSV